jgi:hypothetical protein
MKSAGQVLTCPALTFKTHGNPEKSSFRSISSLRNQILSSEYRVYACGKIFLRASILNEIPDFSSSPHKIAKMGISTYGKPYVLLLSLRLLRAFAMLSTTPTRAKQCPFLNANNVTTSISRHVSPNAPAGTIYHLFARDVSTTRKTS